MDEGEAKQAAARTIVRAAAKAGGALTLQASGEFFFATTRKRKLRPEAAMTEVARWRVLFGAPLIASPECLSVAMRARTSGAFQFRDAMLLATAGAAGCTAVISEDMAPGARLGGVQVVRAFDGAALSPEAAALLG